MSIRPLDLTAKGPQIRETKGKSLLCIWRVSRFSLLSICSFSPSRGGAILRKVSHKSLKIAALIESLEDGAFDPHYRGYFKCFNQQLFFEAHEVLEELWLRQRGQPRDLFYKGLIQLAGAFVHIQKRRRQPALALFKLARENLGRFPSAYDGLELGDVLKLIADWVAMLEGAPAFFETLDAVVWPKLAVPVS